MFHSFDDIDWRKAAIILGGLIILWAGLESLIPASWYATGATILGAVSAMLLYFINAKKKG